MPRKGAVKIPPMLSDMRWVYKGREPETEAQKKQKAFLDSDQRNFMAQMHALEREYAKIKADRKTVQTVKKDRGSDRALEAIGKIMAKHKES